MKPMSVYAHTFDHDCPLCYGACGGAGCDCGCARCSTFTEVRPASALTLGSPEPLLIMGDGTRWGPSYAITPAEDVTSHTTPLNDPVHTPHHYTRYPTQPIELTQHLNFCRGNVVKYVARAGNKGDEYEDLAKARRYLEVEMQRVAETTYTTNIR